MQEIRKLLRNDQWAKLEPLLPGKAGDPEASAQDPPPVFRSGAVDWTHGFAMAGVNST